MKLNELKNKWNGINVYNNVMEGEMLEDLKSTFNELVRSNGGELLKLDVSFDLISGYILMNGKFIYFDYRLNEDGKINLDDSSWMNGILVRSLKGMEDRIGGEANYTNFDGFNSTVNSLSL